MSITRLYKCITLICMVLLVQGVNTKNMHETSLQFLNIIDALMQYQYHHHQDATALHLC